MKRVVDTLSDAIEAGLASPLPVKTSLEIYLLDFLAFEFSQAIRGASDPGAQKVLKDLYLRIAGRGK